MPDTQKDFYKKLLGRTGESKAVSFLKKKKYRILKKNYVTKIGEVDIIAEQNGVIVFIEVKTRDTLFYGRPAEAITTGKQAKYRRMAMQYLQSTDDENALFRFDVIEILPGEINHIENAF